MSRRRLGILVGLLVLAGALVYVARPVGHIPIYDANLVRLAETELQGYCAGDAFWKSAGEGDAGKARACRAQYADSGQFANVTDLAVVPRAFCQAIVEDGWDGDVPTCLQIMVDNQYWPTYDGGITDQWNRARPYPVSAIPSGPPPADDGSRTGGSHGGGQRPDDSRLRTR